MDQKEAAAVEVPTAQNAPAAEATPSVEGQKEEGKGSDSEGSSYVMMEKESESSTESTHGDPQITDEVVASLKEPEEPDHQKECQLLKEEAEKSDEEDGWTYVLGHDKLKKRVLVKGSGSRPVNGQLVTIKYVGRLSDGTEVDKQESLTFVLGDGDVIQAFDLCVALSDDQEKLEIYTDAQYAYGSIGKAPDIPPNAALTYEVEILKVEPAVDFATISVAQRIAMADQKRERGNFLYSRGDHPAAINSYSKALKIVDDSAENHSEEASELQRLIDMRLKCFNNMAAAQLKVEAFDAAIKSSDEVLTIQPENVKALFRKGKCLAGKGENEAAISCLRKALKLEPESKIIHQELSRLTNLHKAQEKSQKAMYQRMLGTDKKPFLPPKPKGDSKMLYYGIAGALVAAGVSIALAAFYKLNV